MSSPQGITREEAREICSEAVLRNGSYDPADGSNVARLDRAINAAFREFCSRVKTDIACDVSLTLTAGQNTLDLTGITGFDVDRFMDAFLVSAVSGRVVQIRFADYKDVLSAKNNQAFVWVMPGLTVGINGTGVSQDILASFSPERNGLVFGQVFTEDMILNLRYFREFNNPAAASGTKFNVARQWCDQICWWGVPLFYDSMQSVAVGASNPLTQIRKNWEELIARATYPGPQHAVQSQPRYY